MPPQPTRQSVPDRRIGTSLAAAESPREFHPEAESAQGIAPRAAHRTGRKPLDLSGSCHPVKAAASHQDPRVRPVAR